MKFGIWLGGATLLLALTASARNIHWPEFVAQSDLVWTNGLAPDFYNGAFIGDGMQGAMIMRDNQDPNAVRMLLGHYQAITHSVVPKWEYCQSRVFAGDIIVAPKSPALSQTMRMGLWNGETTGAITTTNGSIAWSAFCERTHNVIIATVTGAGGEADAIPTVREEWGITPRLYLDTKQKKLEDIAEYLPPKPEKRAEGEIEFVVNKMKFRGAHVVVSQLVREPDGRKVLFLAIGTDDSTDVNLAAAKAEHEAIVRVHAAVKEGVTKLTASHRTWWHRYLQSSCVALPDDAYWQKFWWLQIYKFGSASAENSSLIIDTQGPWIWNTGWAAVWWNLNVQLSYYPMFSANKLETGRSLLNGVERLYQSGALRQNAGQSPGITIGRSTTQDGLGSWGDEHGNMTWVLQCWWKYWRYSADDAVGKKLFPMLKDNASFLIAQLDKDTNGILHLKPSRSPEYDEQVHPDVNYGLMSTRWVLQTLLAMNTELNFNDPQTNIWSETLAHLTRYPTDTNDLRISADLGFNMSHRHYSHLVGIYPYHILTPDQGMAERDLIQRSVNRWQHLKGGHAGYSFTGGCAMYATLGEGDNAIASLDQLKPMVRANTMYYEGGGQVVETPLSGVESIDYMLLQSWGGVIRVFPAVPSRWKDLAFENLRTEGAFLVSAELKNGLLDAVTIRSEAGKSCVVQNPWKDKPFVVWDEQGRKFETSRVGNQFTFNTKAGKSYTLKPTGD
ncbi:MAG: glycoside hydrolase family 95-like protein [Verrucomicrobiota bacterium]